MSSYDAFLLVSFGGPESQDEVMPFVLVSPITVDGNNNGKYDPIKEYRKKLVADGKPTQSVETLLDAPTLFVDWVKQKKRTYADTDVIGFFGSQAVVVVVLLRKEAS